MRQLAAEEVAELGGCLYGDGSEVVALDDDELTALTEPLEADRVAGRFRVVTSIRSKNFGSDPMHGPFHIVLHHTGGTRRSDIPTLTEPHRGAGGQSVSANDYITKDGTIFELCEFPKKAWHALSWNATSWGIEIENLGNNADPYPDVQVDAVVWRCRERRRVLGISDAKQLVRHRDIQSDKDDTSDNFPYAEVRRRIFAATDRTDGLDGALRFEKYNVAGIGVHNGLLAVAFAGALRAEKVDAMSLHSVTNTGLAAGAASRAPFRHGPRLVALGKEAANAVTAAGHRLGSEDKSDLLGAVGAGNNHDAMIRDTIVRAVSLIEQVAVTEQLDAQRLTSRFTAALVALHPYFQGKT